MRAGSFRCRVSPEQGKGPRAQGAFCQAGGPCAGHGLMPLPASAGGGVGPVRGEGRPPMLRGCRSPRRHRRGPASAEVVRSRSPGVLVLAVRGKGGAACCTREEGAETARPIATGRPVPGCERGAVAMPSPVKLPSGVSSSGAKAAMPQEVRARGRRRCPRSGAPPFSRCRSLRSGRERSLRAHEECLSFPSVLASLSLGETEEPPYGGGSFARRGCEPAHVMQFGDYPGVKAGRPGIPAPGCPLARCSAEKARRFTCLFGGSPFPALRDGGTFPLRAWCVPTDRGSCAACASARGA